MHIMKNHKIKVFVIPIIAVFSIVGLFYFNMWTKDYFKTSEDILDNIKDLQSLEYSLDTNLIKSSFFLYYDYDNIYKNLEQIKEKVTYLENISHFKSSTHEKSFEYLQKYKAYINDKEDKIIKFETLNSEIKNSTVYIPSLILKYMTTIDIDNDISMDNDIKIYTYKLTNLLASLFLLRNSTDIDFLNPLKNLETQLEMFDFSNNDKLAQFHSVLLSHLKVYIDNYPDYYKILNYLVNDTKGKAYLSQINNHFVTETKKETDIITIFSFGSTAFFLLLLAYTGYLLLSLEKKNIQLIKMASSLEKITETDDITGLPNRRAFNHDVIRYKNPSFILINIDGFKNINDFYGTKAGDYILKEFGNFLKEFVKKIGLNDAKIYRLGGDEFGILYENKRKETESYVKRLLSELENKVFKYKHLELTLNVSIGITFEAPLLEKADMVLKEVKNRREKYLIYSKDFDKSVEILENLNILDIIKTAVKEDKIVPFFQPIVDNKTGEIEKYEVLARLETSDNRYLSPGVFLPIAKESKYYRDITKAIVRKAFETIVEKDVNLSINLSIEDVLDHIVVDYFLGLLKDNENLAHKVTVELLESESIQNYREIQKFVDKIRQFGAHLAIDDFGAGYSNFSHVVNLKPDFVKIDGSLIKDIHKDPYSKIIVSTIVDFSKKLNIKTVAEFVSSVEIYKVIRELDIDYSQGFFVGKPIRYIDEYKKIESYR